MQTIIRYFLASEIANRIGDKKKQLHAFFRAKGGLAPRCGDILNLNVPTSRIATMQHTDYDQYQGTFEVVAVETTPVFDTTDVKAEFPIVVETIVNVYLRRPGVMDLPCPNRRPDLEAEERDAPDKVITVEAGSGSNYAKQAESAMLSRWNPMRMMTERFPFTQEQAEEYVEQFYTQYPLMREWVAKSQAGTHHKSDAFPDTTFATPDGLRSTIAKLTRSLREAKGITLAVAGRATGYAPSRLSAMELGRDYMLLSYLDYLADHPGAVKADSVSEDATHGQIIERQEKAFKAVTGRDLKDCLTGEGE